MSDTLYIKIDQNIVVRKPNVVLKDIASLTSTNESVVNKLKTMKVHTFHTTVNDKKEKTQLKVFSILKIIELIGKEYPNLDVQNMGEMDFVLEYVPKEEPKWMGAVKATLICILIFFGSTFTIMTFNNDVGVTEVFHQFYKQVMGKPNEGFTVLEICYSIGLGVGILTFFNHIGKKKITHDPTPIQVQMRKYEKEVDTTFIENSSRKGTNIDVD